MANTTDPALPNYTRAEAAAALPDLNLLDDLFAGTRRMWDMSNQRGYIRKWTDEKAEVYHIRRQCESLFDGLGRVNSAAVGMLFAKPPEIEWNQSEEAFATHWQNLDGAGTSGPVLLKRFSDDVIPRGIGLILVDHPTPPAGVEVTGALEEELNLRPMWSLYGRRQILSWRVGKVQNRHEPVQVVLEEPGVVDDGTYGTKSACRYRVLRLLTGPAGQTATWELYEESKDTGSVQGFRSIGSGTYTNRNGDVAERLPIAVAYTGRTDAPFCASMPLLGVAFANLSHWQLSTELRFGRMVAAIEQPVVIGELKANGRDTTGQPIPGKLKVGWLTGIQLAQGGEYKWVGPSGAGLDQLKQGVEEKLQQIGQMGLSFLVSDTRAAETAQAKMLDATAENATLATAAQGIEDAWNAALEIHAWYLGIEKAGAPVLTINRDFTNTVLDPATMTAYVDAVQRAGLDPMIMLRAWQQGGRIAQDVDLDEQLATMMANQAAIEEQKARAAADLAARNRTQQPEAA